MSVANKTKFRLLGLLPVYYGLLLSLCCLLPQRIAAGPAAGAAVSQRRINELAASLQRARLALIENTGMRRPQEPLPAYFLRIVEIGPGETDQARKALIEGFIQTLIMAEKDTASLRARPVLRHNDAANQRQWQRAVDALCLLPARIQKIQAVWQDLQRNGRVNRQPAYHRLGTEFTQATELTLVAYNALRDAKP